MFSFISIGLVIVFQKFLIIANGLTNKTLSAVRKLFHLLIFCVFLPGLLYDRQLLLLCSFGMFILLSLIELIRYYEIGSLSELIDDLMGLFVDQKDREGELVLSHIYLLVGLSFPVWLSNYNGKKL